MEKKNNNTEGPECLYTIPFFFVSGIIWTDVRPSAFDSFHLCSFGEAYHSLALGLPIDIGAALQNCHLAKRFSVLDHFRVLQPSGWIDFHWLLRKWQLKALGVFISGCSRRGELRGLFRETRRGYCKVVLRTEIAGRALKTVSAAMLQCLRCQMLMASQTGRLIPETKENRGSESWSESWLLETPCWLRNEQLTTNFHCTGIDCPCQHGCHIGPAFSRAATVSL